MDDSAINFIIAVYFITGLVCGAGVLTLIDLLRKIVQMKRPQLPRPQDYQPLSWR